MKIFVVCDPDFVSPCYTTAKCPVVLSAATPDAALIMGDRLLHWFCACSGSSGSGTWRVLDRLAATSEDVCDSGAHG